MLRATLTLKSTVLKGHADQNDKDQARYLSQFSVCRGNAEGREVSYPSSHCEFALRAGDQMQISKLGAKCFSCKSAFPSW